MRWWGKYRGLVANNKDPEHRGRIRMVVPLVLGEELTAWALPCFQIGGMPNDVAALVPKEGSVVWAEFEQGDENRPVYVGAWMGAPNDVTDMPDEYVYKEENPGGGTWGTILSVESARRANRLSALPPAV